MCSQFPLILSELQRTTVNCMLLMALHSYNHLLFPFTALLFFLVLLFYVKSYTNKDFLPSIHLILHARSLHISCRDPVQMYLSVPGKEDVIQVQPKTVLSRTHTWLHTDNLATHTAI